MLTNLFGNAGLAFHPVNFVLAPFRSAYGDHWHLKLGRDGKVIVRCARGPLAVVGEFGKVLAIGLAIGVDSTANERLPTDGEFRLLLDAVRWLGRFEGWMHAELRKANVCILAPHRWLNQRKEPLKVTVRVSMVKAMEAPKLSVLQTVSPDVGGALG